MGIEDRPPDTRVEDRWDLRNSDINAGTRLVDIWMVLVKRKLLIIGTLLSSLAAATVLIFLVQPIYEGRVVLEIGRITYGSAGSGAAGSSRLLEDLPVVLQWLKEEYQIDQPGRPRELPRLNAVENPSKAGQTLILLKGWDHTAVGAQKVVNDVAQRLIQRHEAMYQEVRKTQETRIANLDTEISELETQINLLARVTGQLEDRGQAAIIAMERGERLTMLGTLRWRRTDLALSLSPPLSQATRLIREPTVGESPIQPRPVLYLSLGAAVGLLLGILSAILFELLSKVRNEATVRKDRRAKW